MLRRTRMKRLARLPRRSARKGIRDKYGVRIDAEGRRLRTYNGIEYHSRLEARYAAALDLKMQCVGPYQIRSWKRQVPVKLEVNGRLICTYIVDFVIEHMDGHLDWIEVKGLETETWKLKAKLFHALFPDRKLTIVRTA